MCPASDGGHGAGGHYRKSLHKCITTRNSAQQAITDKLVMHDMLLPLRLNKKRRKTR